MKFNGTKNNSRFAGALILLGLIAGICSVSPVADSGDYLTQAAMESTQVLIATLFQFVLALIYLGIGLFLYPIVSDTSKTMAIGFLSFRIIASALMIIGTVFLLSILFLSQGYVNQSGSDVITLENIGYMLRQTRDYYNHIFMVLVLGFSNVILYILFLKSNIVPRWMSIWGLTGTLLSALASVLVFFQVVQVITIEYLLLNAPTAMFEIILGSFLLFKGITDKGAGMNAASN